jgi:AcrR family transcriptional regulator
MTLFFERGYDEVTVTDIAKQAGLTKRSFFNHFADKREVVFAAADGFEESVISALAEADSGLDPLDAAVSAFTRASAGLEEFPEFARARRKLIDSALELQERDLVKTASLTAAVADTLASRGLLRRDALYVAQAATTVFTTGVDEWAQDPQWGLAASIQQALGDLRSALRPVAGSSRALRAHRLSGSNGCGSVRPSATA